jgi:hypothetical protein
MKLLHCPHCQNQVYFENTFCEKCTTEFGFSPEKMAMVELNQQPGHCGCMNRSPVPVCNWVVSEGLASGLCASCQLTSTIPPLDSAKNLERWVKAEAAKRRLLYTLLGLGLMLRPKQGPADPGGIEFRWLAPQPGAPILTGHDSGVITLNMEEVDDGAREVQRERLNEKMRTVLGHLRHEVAHHLFEKHVQTTEHLSNFRALFGDETQDYAIALERHYNGENPAHWQSDFVSAYASSHPLEDWAETTAHYLLMADALETARAWGLRLGPSGGHADTLADVDEQGGLSSGPFSDEAVHHWLPIARFLNAMSRSLGLRDSYAYLLAPKVLEKLQFVSQTLAPISPARALGDATTWAQEAGRMVDA